MFGISLLMLFITFIIVMIGGAITARVTKIEEFSITWHEFAAIGAIVLIVNIPATSWLGGMIAVNDSVSGYKEYWNGSIVEVAKATITCERDGDCQHHYDCDPYPDTEYYYDTEYYTDSKGKTQSRSVRKSRPITSYHDCPYVTRETTYWVVDSFGDKHVHGSNWIDAKPVKWRRDGDAIPKRLDRGEPPLWAKAKASMDAGDPEPAYKEATYTNYLLAAQDSLLQAYSDKVEKYRAAGLLVDHTLNVHENFIYDFYKADKVVFAGGIKPANYTEWQDALGRTNSRIGTEKQGDAHLIIVPASRVPAEESQDYAMALRAYMQSRDYGKVALAKNTILIVVGVSADMSTVEWSRATTGIPEGNGSMLDALSSMQGTAFTPRALIGWPQAKLVSSGEKTKLTFDRSAESGKIEQIVTEDFPFARPCMEKCDDKGDTGNGYVYLKSSAYISTSAQIWVCIFAGLSSVPLWWLATFLDPFGSVKKSWRNTVPDPSRDARPRHFNTTRTKRTRRSF